MQPGSHAVRDLVVRRACHVCCCGRQGATQERVSNCCAKVILRKGASRKAGADEGIPVNLSQPQCVARDRSLSALHSNDDRADGLTPLIISCLINEAGALPRLAGSAQPVRGGRTPGARREGVLVAKYTFCVGCAARRAACQVPLVTVSAGPTGDDRARRLRRRAQSYKWQVFQVHIGRFRAGNTRAIHLPSGQAALRAVPRRNTIQSNVKRPQAEPG